MITAENQQKLLLDVSNRLKKEVNAYAIGGTAMMFLGLKDVTLDIDLVFENKKDKDIFKEALKSLGYEEMDSFKIYGKKDNHPEMLTLGDERFDLFVSKVIYFIFSENMQKRAEAIHQFGSKLILKIADPLDIIMMKCATDRAKDIDDARKIIESRNINWKLLIDEAKNQIKLGRHTAAFDLGEFLEKLKEELKVDIPNSALDELFKIVEKQAAEKRKKS